MAHTYEQAMAKAEEALMAAGRIDHPERRTATVVLGFGWIEYARTVEAHKRTEGGTGD